MQALLAEKAFVLRELDTARESARCLRHSRTGLFVKSDTPCSFKLGKLLQDIAGAKLAELRLLSFIAHIEEKLRFALRLKPEGEIAIGSAPETRAPRHQHTLAAMWLAYSALRPALKLGC